MTIQGSDQQAQSLDVMGQALARNHHLDGENADLVALYRQQQSLTAWLEQAKLGCQQPSADTVRIADWLLDNDYQVLRAIRQVSLDLPLDFYRRLPALKNTEGERLPRVLSVAHAVLRAMPKQLSISKLVSYINAYQQQSGLNLAELWALPSLLRLACLESLIDAFEQLMPELVAPCTMSSYAIEGRMTDPADRIAEAINGLAAIQSIDWQLFVDQTSQVERILRLDPAAAYGLMDFETRNQTGHTCR